MPQFCGPLADHMALHIILMNVVGPLAAIGLSRAGATPARSGPLGSLPTAVVIQIALLWGWHAPGVLETALREPALHALMQASLFAAAVWFWSLIFSFSGAERWRAFLPLLATGKLFCLVGVLMVFAPRALYPELAFAAPYGGSIIGDGMPDQQLAGLLMLVACPLSYLVAAVYICARWLRELDDAPHGPPARLAVE